MFPDLNESTRLEYLRFHETICSYLLEMTSVRIGAYSAVQEWNIQPSLCFYLPAPLSGIDLMPIALMNANCLPRRLISLYVDVMSSMV